MANPPVPKKWTDAKIVPPVEKSQKQIEDLGELAKISKNVPAHRLVKLLKKEYNEWLRLATSSDPKARAKVAPKVIVLFNTAVDSIMSKAGGISDNGSPCGGAFGNPCEDAEKTDKIDFEKLAQKIFQRLVMEARVERERAGWGL
jgi:hypothetical protein